MSKSISYLPIALTVFLGISSISLVQSQFIGLNDHGVPQFKINLDEAPYKRFEAPTEYFKEGILYVVEKYQAVLPPEFLEWFTEFDYSPRGVFPDYFEEMDGIADILELDRHLISMLNYVYELSTYCTSSIVKLKDGTIVHDRNLDFAFSEDMKKIAFEGLFVKDGQLLFSSVLFGGTVSLYTGMRPGAFSISENQRAPSNFHDPDSFYESVAMIFAGYTPISFLVRDVLTNENSYENALKRLANEDIIAPGYLILAGTKDYEGAIISRGRFEAVDITTLSEDRWYLL